MVIKILEMALPVLIMLGLGYFCKAKNVFDEKGLLGLKAFISNITLSSPRSANIGMINGAGSEYNTINATSSSLSYPKIPVTIALTATKSTAMIARRVKL